jgi:McbB family protein
MILDIEDADEKVFALRSYLLHDLPDGRLFVHCDAGVFQVWDTDVADWLRVNDGARSRLVTQRQMLSAFAGKSDEAMCYLKANGLIEPLPLVRLDFSRAVVSAADSKLANHLHSAISSMIPTTVVAACDLTSSGLSSVIGTESTLYIVCLNPYKPSMVRKMLDYLQCRPKDFLLMSCVYNNAMYIHNLYCRAWKPPCPNCVMEHIRAALRVRRPHASGYQSLMDQVYAEDPDASTTIRMTERQRLNSAAMLAQSVHRIVENRGARRVFWQDFSTVTRLDLFTLTASVDRALHWELCDCSKHVSSDDA